MILNSADSSTRIDGDNPSAVWDIPNVIGIEYADGGGYRYIENGVIENAYTSEIVYFAISK